MYLVIKLTDKNDLVSRIQRIRVLLLEMEKLVFTLEGPCSSSPPDSSSSSPSSRGSGSPGIERG